MRVTNSMSVFNHTNSIQKNLQKKSQIEEKLNTMKEVNKLSDDPYKAIKVLNYNNEIASTERYESNCDEATGWLDTNDSALDTLGNLTKNLKETIVAAGNGSYSDEEIKTLSIKVNETMKEIANVLNTTHGGKYIFSGSETSEAPVKVIESQDENGNDIVKLEINPNINTNDLKIAIGEGIDVQYNVKLSDIIPDMNYLNDLSESLAKGKEGVEEVTTTHSQNIDKMFESITSIRSTYGIKTNTVESMKNKNEEDLVQLKENLSVTQDVDFAEAYMQLKQAELTYTASIQTGAKVLQTTILDFL